MKKRSGEEPPRELRNRLPLATDYGPESVLKPPFVLSGTHDAGRFENDRSCHAPPADQ
jgi:hypothetical protein